MKQITFSPNPAVSYDYDDVLEYFFLEKSFEKFGKNAENLHCVKICNEAINLPVHSRQFPKRHHWNRQNV